MKEFNVSREVSNLITTVFLLGYVFGVSLSQFSLGFYLITFPVFILGSRKELVGRKPISVLLIVVDTLLYIEQAIAPNIQTHWHLVTRFLSGFFSVAPLTNCGGKQFSRLYKLTCKL